MRGRMRGVCSRDIVRFMSITTGNAMRNGRFVLVGAGATALTDNDKRECRYADESTSVLPVESRIESTRVKIHR